MRGRTNKHTKQADKARALSSLCPSHTFSLDTQLISLFRHRVRVYAPIPCLPFAWISAFALKPAPAVRPAALLRLACISWKRPKPCLQVLLAARYNLLDDLFVLNRLDLISRQAFLAVLLLPHFVKARLFCFASAYLPSNCSCMGTACCSFRCMVMPVVTTPSSHRRCICLAFLLKLFESAE